MSARPGIRVRATKVRFCAGAAACVLCLLCAVARACPDCPAGQAARREAFGDGVAARLWIALLPFAVVGLASLRAERVGRRR